MRQKMRAGSLDQRVAVQRETRVADGYGGAAVSWSTQATVWARVEAVRGQERVIADQDRGVVGYRITARNAGVWAGVTAADRLVWAGVVLNVRGAPAAGRAAYRTIEAESGVNT
ncbi:MAG: phage head closure protein [Alphaproteobacteria bacterium]|nr:phage head closure protein [Alphaproteobacteria bacterium]